MFFPEMCIRDRSKEWVYAPTGSVAKEGACFFDVCDLQALTETLEKKDVYKRQVLAKSKGSSNPHNLVKATILALGEMRDARMVAQNRGVSMEKVFRG